MLTNNEDYMLRVELEDFEGNKRYTQTEIDNVNNLLKNTTAKFYNLQLVHCANAQIHQIVHNCNLIIDMLNIRILKFIQRESIIN